MKRLVKNDALFRNIHVITQNRLYTDLKSLIRALEIYLTEFVEKINNDIFIPGIDKLKIDHVLSFNYTNTYEKKYGVGKNIEYNFIHREAKISNTIDSSNMVLGIYEYLPQERKDKETYFIGFKKYYQRIFKSTGFIGIIGLLIAFGSFVIALLAFLDRDKEHKRKNKIVM